MPTYHKEYPAICCRCGKQYTCYSARRKWCDECKPIIDREQNRMWKGNHKHRDIRKTIVSETFEETIKNANEAGMTYGRYQAMLYARKMQ